MANPGAGNRFTSVNLNKSYGQSSNPNQFNYGSGRGRSGSGGGMAVLSGPRTSYKASGPKLSVPPPLNLPSRRKEHEKFDSLGSVNGSIGGGIPGSGVRPSSSGLGWSKPSSIVTEERDESNGVDRPMSGGKINDSNSYMPPSARSGSTASNVSAPKTVGKSSVLRGEDFPSLKATLAAGNVPVQKLKDTTHQKQRLAMNDEGSHTDMRPQVHSQSSVGKSVDVDSANDRNSINSRPPEHGRRQDTYFPGPLPLARLSPRSDWADDERDTSRGLADMGRETSFLRPETYWERDFDFPRTNFLPQKQVWNDRYGQRDNDVGKGSSNEVYNADPLKRDVREPSREGQDAKLWRHPASRERFASLDVGSRPTFMNRKTVHENKYIHSQFGGNIQDQHISGLNVNRDLGSGRRDLGYVQGSNAAGADRRELNKYKVDALQNSMGSSSSFSAGSRGFAENDHSSNFGRHKSSYSRGEKPYRDDPFIITDFDVQDPFSGGIIGVVKRKKDTNKHMDFHDPVRESFEAELERVQKMQEQERQRVIEEQERAMEVAIIDEEERQRVAREQEERQRKLEEDAREAAWRVEQERLEAIRRAEEHRLTKEDDKQRLLMEEERRRHAAKQKLQELEERIARRQGEGAKADGAADVQGNKMSVSREDDFAGWEDGERMVERITNTTSSDSSVRRPFDMGSKPMPEGSFAFVDREKSLNSWRRDVFENGNNSSFFSSEHENGYKSPRRDDFVGGRELPRKDFNGGSGYMPTRGYYRTGTVEPQMEDFVHARGHRWSISGDGDPYGGNTQMEAELHESIGQRFDVDWGQGRDHGYSSFAERVYQNSELEDLYTDGRSRYPARQARVSSPPSFPSAHRTSFRNEIVQVRSSTYQDVNIRFNQAVGSEPAAMSYQNTKEELSDKSDTKEHFARNDEQLLNRSSTPGCESQSSLCVSNAPSSPTQLSHDGSRDSLGLSGTGELQDVCNSVDEVVLVKDKDVKGSQSSLSLDDDEEWTIDNNGSQQQEEYDEDVCYNEEVQVGDDDNGEFIRELEGIHLERKGSPHTMENTVLGFDQGVEVGMPNEDYETSPRSAANLIVPQEFGGPTGESPEGSDVSRHMNQLRVERSEQSDYVSEPHISTSLDPLSSGDSISASIITTQESVPSSIGTSSQSSTQTVTPNVAGIQGVTVLPVKLQFGLFSVPAIQIGSIQMPLQPPPQFGPLLSNMNVPQTPIFQLGQLRYPSPVSQGFTPLTPPSMSFVQPNIRKAQQQSLPASEGSAFARNIGRISASSSAQGSKSIHKVVMPKQGLVNDEAFNNLVSQTMSPIGTPTLSVESQAGAKPHTMKTLQRSSRAANAEAIGSELTFQEQSIALDGVHGSIGSQGDSHSDRVVMTLTQTQLEEALKPVHCHNDTVSVGDCTGSLSEGGVSSSSPSLLTKDYSLPATSPISCLLAGQKIQFGAVTSPAILPPSTRVVSHSTRTHTSSQVDSRTSRSMPACEIRAESRQRTEKMGNTKNFVRNSKQLNNRTSERRAQGGPSSSHFTANLGDSTGPGPTGQGPFGNKGRRFAFTARNPGARSSSSLSNDAYRSEVNGFQRRRHGTQRFEFRVRQAIDGNQSDPKSSYDGNGSGTRQRSGPQNNLPSTKSHISSSDPITTQESARKETSTSGADSAWLAEGILKRNISSGGDTNAPLQSGIVQVFKQPGIEVPSDEDDFIEVRSKRQMLNDRREQREKDIKAKSTNMRKAQQNSLHASEGSAFAWNLGRISASSSAQGSKSIHKDVMPKQGLVNDEPFNNLVSQTMSLIGTPTINVDSQAGTKPYSMKTLQTSSRAANTQLIGSELTFHAQSNALGGVHGSIGSQGNSESDRLLMTTNTQLEEALKPVRSDNDTVSAGDCTVSLSEGVSSSSSPLPLVTKDNSLSATSPITCLLAGQKIQFGAVTSPTILPPSTRVVSHSIRTHTSSQVDSRTSRSMPACKIEHSNTPCRPLEDCEAEAEAAASAVAVAAISNDEVVGTAIGSSSPSISVSKGLRGTPAPQQAASHSKGEESLNVALPADLSVETPPMSFWPPLPSPFPGNPSSHSPFYDMNPMMGGPVFAIAPHEESGQPQKSGAPRSSPLGTWQQCHPGVYSFYSPPGGFTAPFISPPPGSMPELQGRPPHMVVYNHFAPVGQFGQVGLSYMGSTYIPSGKQPDWKHNPTSSAMGGSEGEMNSSNMITVQQSANVPAQVQHITSGSPLLSMAPPPLTMFEVSPFQSTTDASLQPHWQSFPQSMQLHQQPGDGHSLAVDTHTSVTRSSDQLGSVCLSSHPQRVVSVETSKNKEKNLSGRNYYSPYQRGGAQKKNNSGAEWSNGKMRFQGTKVKQIYVPKQSITGGT